MTIRQTVTEAEFVALAVARMEHELRRKRVATAIMLGDVRLAVKIATYRDTRSGPPG